MQGRNAMRSAGKLHIAFVSSKEMYYPPNVDYNKVYYISREFIKRGAKVTWLEMSQTSERWQKDGIDFVKLGAKCPRLVCQMLQLLQMVSFCRTSKVDCVYSDEWLFQRESPLQRLIFQIGSRAAGIRYVFDQRDPFIDYEVARGVLKEGSWRHKVLRFSYRLDFEFTDLAIFPSEVYAAEFSIKGIPEGKKMGVIRGVDKQLFNPQVDGRVKRAELGLEGKFVVGWFGMMQPYRQIEEVVIPLIERAGESIPNIHFLIGGLGELSDKFVQLQKSRPDLGMTFLGFVPYANLPEHLAACDVLLCPLNTARHFAKYASPLKILESLAVGRPIIATETKVREGDFKDLQGVIWTGPDCKGFMDSLMLVHADYAHYREQAAEQALDFDRYTLESTISKIVDAVEKLCD